LRDFSNFYLFILEKYGPESKNDSRFQSFVKYGGLIFEKGQLRENLLHKFKELGINFVEVERIKTKENKSIPTLQKAEENKLDV
jgi:hypothetical protein